MSEKFNSIAGQSLIDVCLNTYGSLDFFAKLVQENGIEDLDALPASGTIFLYDKQQVIDQQVNRVVTLGKVRFATGYILPALLVSPFSLVDFDGSAIVNFDNQEILTQ